MDMEWVWVVHPFWQPFLTLPDLLSSFILINIRYNVKQALKHPFTVGTKMSQLEKSVFDLFHDQEKMDADIDDDDDPDQQPD